MTEDNRLAPRCIILPFQDDTAPGTGLALHFLLGNVIAVHTGFKECWFGWRTAKIFPHPQALTHYCQGHLSAELDLQLISAAQNVQCWVHGSVGAGSVELHLFDARGNTRAETCAFTVRDHLVGLRRCFLDFLDRCGYPFIRSRRPMALWEEIISPEALRLVGRALETFYLHSAYDDAGSALGLSSFKTAVEAAPDAFMANALMGWAHYRRQESALAKVSFLKSLTLNPHAVGSMAGLTGCAVMEKNENSGCYWAARKAAVQGQDVSAAVQKIRQKIQT